MSGSCNGNGNPEEDDNSNSYSWRMQQQSQRLPYRRPHGQRQRKMVNVGNNDNIATGPSFTVLTYNVLADVLAYSKKFPNCPIWALRWEHRRQNLFKEILQFDADIICLQKVQHNHYEDFFHPELTKQGYGGLFNQTRIWRVVQGEKEKTVYTNCGWVCSIYRLSQFDFLKCEGINFRDFSKSFPRFEKENISLNVVLEFKNTTQCLCIANTHIHANPKNSDVKLWQVSCMLSNLELLVKKNNNASLVICGDFNSLSGSAPHTLLTQAYCYDYHPDGAETFQHKLPLSSAYCSYFHCDVDEGDITRKMDSDTREPNFTNFVSDFQGTLDYILYTATNLKVKDYDALPSPNHSSDHIPLAAKFSL